jgi:hypothetical protein
MGLETGCQVQYGIYSNILYNLHTWTFNLEKTNLELRLKVGYTHLRPTWWKVHIMGLDPGCPIWYL